MSGGNLTTRLLSKVRVASALNPQPELLARMTVSHINLSPARRSQIQPENGGCVRNSHATTAPRATPRLTDQGGSIQVLALGENGDVFSPPVAT